MSSYRMGLRALLTAGLLSSASQAALAAADSGSASIETVVVTAEKRQEKVQNVPISVDTLSGDTAAAHGIRTSADLVAAVPSLTWMANQYGSPFIRGIGLIVKTPGNQSSVPVYVDGVLQISPLQGNFAFNNIQQIEVLKGPQGTLFGRNANGGVINITTFDPSQESSADIKVGYANYSTVDASFYGNTALTDDLAANLAVTYHNQSDGWGKNIFTGKDVHRDRSADVRGKLRWTPDSRTDIIFTGEYSRLYNESDAYHLIQGTVGVGGTLPPPGFYDTDQDVSSSLQTEVSSGSLRVSHDFGLATFRSISAYTSVNTYWPLDSDVSHLPVLFGPITEKSSGFTQEFQLVSPSDQKVTWIAGLYFIDSDAAWKPIVLTGSEIAGTINQFGHTNATSYAAYGQLTWAVLPDTNLTLGGRYTIDNREVDGHSDLNGVKGTQGFQTTSFQQPTYRVSVDHHFSDLIMGYATVSTGFNSGQFNVGNAVQPAVKPEETVAYEVGLKSQFLDNRLQINAAGYWYNYRNIQVAVTQNHVTIQTNAAAARIQGLELEVQAIPVDALHVQLGLSYTDPIYTDYNNASFFTPAPGGGYVQGVGDASGNQMINAPKWSATASADYTLETDFGSFLTSVNYSYKSKLFWDYQNILLSPPSNLVNASITFFPSGTSNWEVMVWGKNLLNEQIYATQSIRKEAIYGGPAAPLTFGVTVGVHL